MARVLHLFNVFGALTERAMLDYTLGLSRAGNDLTIGYETKALDAPPVAFPLVQLRRIEVQPVENVVEQMERVAEDINDPAMSELLSGLGSAQPDAARHAFDLVHGHFGPRILQGAGWVKRGVPMIVSVYGYDVGRLLRDPNWVERYRWAAGQGVTFVALAKFMEQNLLGLGLPRERVRRIHLGIDLTEHAFEPGPAPTRPRFVFIGRFVEKKGTTILLDAMARLKSDARLDLIGGGPEDAALRDQVMRLGIQDRINFVGVVPFAKLFHYLHGCTAMVQPSVVASDGDAEGAPMVLMTAQASGVPCITTRHSGNPETIPPIGQRFVVHERDAEALARAMEEMIALSSRSREQLQREGRGWIERHFNLDGTVSEYGKLYREVLGGSPAPE